MKKYVTIIATDKPIKHYLQNDEIDILHESQLPEMLYERIDIFREKLKQYVKEKTITAKE